MEFFNSYRTGFPAGPFPSCLRWISRAEAAVLPSPEPFTVCTMGWRWPFFVGEEASIPLNHVLGLT